MNKTISVYFSGTGFEINNQNFLAAKLFHCTKEDDAHLKIGFDGCGVDSISGTIFGTGLDKQCDQVLKLIEKVMGNGDQVTLNIYGHSRGAIGALMLARQLGEVDPDQLSINLAMLDPVPGNLITTSALDPLQISLANKAMDLSECKPLKRVLALYPYVPLPSFAFHAPLFVTYPEHAEVDVDVIAGCHADAEQLLHSASGINALRVHEFLAKSGTLFEPTEDLNQLPMFFDDQVRKATYLKLYEKDLQKVGKATRRDAHAADGSYINAKTNAAYFNEHHKRLAGGAIDAPVALTIERSNNPVSWFKRLTAKYPKSWKILKWSALGIGLACALYFSGGMAAIPFLASFVSSAGMLSILATAPVVGSLMAGLWYGAIKPAVLWLTSRIVYPQYSMRNMPIVEDSPAATTTKSMLEQLNASNDSEIEMDYEYGEEKPYHAQSLFQTIKKEPVVQTAHTASLSY